PFNLHDWIKNNRDLLKPPVGNYCLFQAAQNFIVMIVGGPNSRKDYHFNESEELYYQIEGNILLKIMEDGDPRDIFINEGDMFLLPPNTPHSPQRGPNTVGLVIEKIREQEKDGFLWYCENCGHKLYEEYQLITNIVTQLPPVMEGFYSDENKCTCSKCGTIMSRPIKRV
ncbi:MAG: 3-hydroxyanthranilate 3,4-dioxygenase, partial [Ferruginibacter sp.]